MNPFLVAFFVLLVVCILLSCVYIFVDWFIKERHLSLWEVGFGLLHGVWFIVLFIFVLFVSLISFSRPRSRFGPQ